MAVMPSLGRARVRRASPFVPLALALGVSLGPACAPAEHSLLLEVRSQADVDTLHVEILSLDGSAPATERMERVNRSRDSINNEEPIRIAVSFPGPANVVVYVRATSRDTPPRTLLATRCYAIAGVVRDDVLLVQLDPSVDEDGDGFPRQASATCRDLGDDRISVEACDIGACEDAVAADCDDDPSDDPADASAERRNRAADRYPGAAFFCLDGIDQNCRLDSAALPDGDEPCEDRDGDGWQACRLATSMGLCDCDDTNGVVNPDATDVCGDGVDSDCNGVEALCDNDGDGVPADRPVGGAPDCDDTNPDVSPLEMEDCATAVDDNCNRRINEGCSDGDLDDDGFMACPVGVTTCTSCDCNDCNGAVHPGADPICDGLDNVTGAAASDCPGDADRDGQVSPVDCDDANARVYQNAPERCGDATSENCVDPPMACGEGTDADGDMYTVGTRGQDCDDTDPAVAPDATETCNAVDDDCDGIVNEHGRALDDGGCVFDTSVCATCTTDGDCSGLPCIGGICGGACEVDFRAPSGSIEHCGGCGVACNTGATTVADACLGGSCDCTYEPGVAACAAGSTCCGGVGVTFPGCFDLTTDWENCGFCGTTCPQNSNAPDCTASACTCDSNGAPCATGLTCCGDGCHDLRTDNLNCGYCGHTCGGGSHCESGACVCDNADLFDCNGDLAAQPNDGCEVPINVVNRCGSCGTSCMTANVATASCGGSIGARTCVINTCAAGFDNCNGRTNDGCETPLNTTSNCRACGTVCSPMNAAARCEATGCGYSACSSADFGDCDGNRVNGCETSLTTTSNCRACGTTCNPMNATARCEATACGYSTCSTDFGDCDGNRINGCEASLSTTTRCGACSTDCTMLARVGTVTCGGGAGARVCSISTCASNYANCDGMVGNGCETTLSTLTNCTGCGDTCSFTNAAESCATGACVMGACDMGFLNCDGMTGNGCETAISGSACGAGCVDCTSHPNVASASCSAGTCTYVCAAGFADCNLGMPGCETDVRTVTNCGACGNACGMDSGTGTQAETCVDSGGVYRCECRSTRASGLGEACGGASSLCCATGPACQMTSCM